MFKKLGSYVSYKKLPATIKSDEKTGKINCAM